MAEAQLGYLDPKQADDKDYVQNFIRSRMARLGISPRDYDVTVSKGTGLVKANSNEVPVEWTVVD